jgi:hypothetical protein
MYICCTYNNFTEDAVAVFSVQQIIAQQTVYLTPGAVKHKEYEGPLAHHVYSCIIKTNAIGRKRRVAGNLQIFTTEGKSD